MSVKDENFKLFRSWVPMKKVSITESQRHERTWTYYEYGPKEADTVVLLPAVSGHPTSFYRQFTSLCPKGYHLLAVSYPSYDSVEGLVKGMAKFLDAIEVDKIHLVGTSLGGYVAQVFSFQYPLRVLSLCLNNTFADTDYYVQNAPCAAAFVLMPTFMLRGIVLQNYPTEAQESNIAHSIDLMVEQLEMLSGRELASRLTINCSAGPKMIGNFPLPDRKITIIDSTDHSALPEKVLSGVYKAYPKAKTCELKSGGNFPYIARAEEFNLFLEVHLRRHGYGHEQNARESEEKSDDEPAQVPASEPKPKLSDSQ